jgi:hypothetical protein
MNVPSEVFWILTALAAMLITLIVINIFFPGSFLSLNHMLGFFGGGSGVGG